MSQPRRSGFPRPALWIAVPTFLVSLAVIALMSLWPSQPAAFVLAFAGAVAVGRFAEARLPRGSDDPRPELRHRRLCRSGRVACARPQGRCHFRALDLGGAQAGAAGAGGLLFYPSQYEGEEQSPHVIYTGATPAQQALPEVDYLIGLGHRRFFLLGTDYVYPRSTNAIIRNYLSSRGIGGDAVDELCTEFGEKSWYDTVQRIHKFAGRDGVIVATLSGDANVHFFRERGRQGFDAEILPVMNLSLSEAEMQALKERNLEGHMVAWTFPHSLDTPENQTFVAEWREFTGDAQAVTNDVMEASWIGSNSGHKGWRRPAPLTLGL